jgi:hypothetical protein
MPLIARMYKRQYVACLEYKTEHMRSPNHRVVGPFDDRAEAGRVADQLRRSTMEHMEAVGCDGYAAGRVDILENSELFTVPAD